MAIRFGFLTTTLVVSSSFEKWTGYPIITNVVITSVFDGHTEKIIETNLELVSEFTSTTDSTRQIQTLLELESQFIGAKVNIHTINTSYSDIDPPPEYDPPPALPHNFNDEGKKVLTAFYMYFPVDNLRLVLYPPDFGDTDEYRKFREVKYTRGNTLITFTTDLWNDEKLFEYSFSFLVSEHKESLLHFFRDSLGRRIKIIDHLGVIRIGFILTPESEIFQPTKGGWSASFRFKQEPNV